MLVYGHNGQLAGPNAVPNAVLSKWVGERVGIENFGPCVTIGVLHRGRLVAVALYNKFLHPNIEVTFAASSSHWQSKANIRGIFRYPFVQLNCKRITATTEATNQRARAFLCRLGFTQEGYHPDALPSGDAVTYGLLRKDAARWLEESHVKGPASDAA